MGDQVLVFLDDSAELAARHYERLSEEDRSRTFWVQTVEETIDMLKNYRERLEIVSLDHDLNGETYVHSGREDCGMEVVRWLEKRNPADYAHVQFIVHSWNENSGPRMVSRLQKAGYKAELSPFGMEHK